MSLFNKTIINLSKTTIDFMSFNLINKLPYYYYELKFIPIVRINKDTKTYYKRNFIYKHKLEYNNIIINNTKFK